MTDIVDILKKVGRAADAYDRLDGWWAERSDHILLGVAGLGLVLRVWSALPTSEGASWLVAVAAGGLTALVVYFWLKQRCGRPAGLFAGIVLAFSPLLIGMSVEGRMEAVAIFLIACSLYALDRSIAARSTTWMLVFDASLLLAVAAGLMSVFFLVAAGAYFLIRMVGPAVTRRMKLVWAAGQAAALAVFHAVHGDQVEYLLRLRLDRELYTGHLGGAFPQLGDSPYEFLLTGTLDQFLFLIPSLPTALLGMLIYALTVLVLFRRETTVSVATAALLLVPFVAGAAAAFARMHPYGMLHYTSCLALFVAAGIGVGLGIPLRGRVLPAIVLALLFVPLWHIPVLRGG